MPKHSYLSALAIPVAVLSLLANTATSAEPSVRVDLIGVGQFAGTDLDLSGHNTKLRNGEPQNRLGGFSALEYTGSGSRYVALADRGPDDGAVAYLCRYQVIDVNISLDNETPVDLKLVESVMLRDRRGRGLRRRCDRDDSSKKTWRPS